MPMLMGTVSNQKLINLRIEDLLTDLVLLAIPAPIIAPTAAYEDEMGRPYPIKR